MTETHWFEKLRAWLLERWRRNIVKIRSAVGLFLLIFPFAGGYSGCGFPSLASIGRGALHPLCSVEAYTEISQYWINAGILWIALIDRGLLWELIKPIVELIARVATARGNVGLASVLNDALRNWSSRSAKPRHQHEAPPTPQPDAPQAPAPASPKPTQRRLVLRIPTLTVPTPVGIVANLIVIAACFAAVIFAAVARERPAKEIGDKPIPRPPPTNYRVSLPDDVDSLWEAWDRCRRVGGWRDAARLNADIPVYGELAIIQETGQELDIPSDWDCPTEWRIERATETNENGP